MLISLIQTSQKRRRELIRFVTSLNAQTNIDLKNIQLIFVDQEENRDIFDRLNPDIELTYIKMHRCSLSYARNTALPNVKGVYVGFPDDDCWYEPETLSKVLGEFDKGFEGVIAKGTDENDFLTNKSPLKCQQITRFYHCGAISYTIFLRYLPDLRFDENIGVGSPYKLSSGEETDYLLQFIDRAGTNIIYNSDIIVHHPRALPGNFKNNEEKQYEYARGWGYLLKKHNYPFKILFKSFVRPCGGMLLSAFKFDEHGVKHSYFILKGRLEGFFFEK